MIDYIGKKRTAVQKLATARNLFFLFFLPSVALPKPPDSLKPYFDMQKALSGSHCKKEIYRGVYAESDRKDSKKLVVDFLCPSKLLLHSQLAGDLIFVTNSNEAWIIHGSKDAKVAESSDVEHYKDPDMRWSSLWLSLYRASEATTEEIKNEAKEFLESYELHLSDEGLLRAYSLKAKRTHLPNLILEYQNKEALPIRIVFKHGPALSFELKRMSIEKLNKVGNRHFAPDTSKAKRVFTF